MLFSVGPGVASSTNVAILHKVFRPPMGTACSSRSAWIADTATKVQLKLDAMITQESLGASRKFLRAVRAQCDSNAVAWNLCKVGTVLQVALGGVTKLRNGHVSPISLSPKLKAKLVKTRVEKR